MAKINRELTIIEEAVLQLLPKKKDFFKEEFKKFFKVSNPTYARRLRVGDSIKDLQLFQYIFGGYYVALPEWVAKEFASKNVTKWDNPAKNQTNIFS